MKNVSLELIFFTAAFFCLASCTHRLPAETDPLDTNFFEVARLIMLEEEIKAYNQLEDKGSRDRFIEEFWRKRDPDPTTDENEFREEFTERIEAANELFGYGFGSRGLNTGRGWNSDQGRVYLVLGPPDRVRHFWREVDPAMRTEVEDPQRSQVVDRVQIEEWFYEKYSTPIEFERGMRGWRLGTQTPAVLSVIQEAKEELLSPESESPLDLSLRLRVFFREDEIVLEIPSDRLNFKEEGEYLRASVRVIVDVIFKGEKLEQCSRTEDFRLTEQELFAKYSFRVSLPYTPREKGVYVFELLVEDLMSLSGSQFRSRIEHKHQP
jgi:GWxTD domain-containing protein